MRVAKGSSEAMVACRTVMLKTKAYGAEYFPRVFGSQGSLVLFNHEDSLWRTDGTVEGTQFVAQFTTLSWGLGVVAQSLLFSGCREERCGLWASDGTAAGTRRLARLFAAGEGGLGVLASDEATLWFMWLKDDNDDRPDLAPRYLCEVWRTDGSAGGTMYVHEFPAYFSGSPFCPSAYVMEDGSLYYAVGELWRVPPPGQTRHHKRFVPVPERP